jgi:hypothetical protein
MSIDLALADAANNCERRGAVATITLKSGIEVVGRIERTNANLTMGTVVVHTLTGGWTTVVKDEIAAVGVEPNDN